MKHVAVRHQDTFSKFEFSVEWARRETACQELVNPKLPWYSVLFNNVSIANQTKR